MKLTDDQQDCLKWLRERGGRGFIDQYGRVVAQGEARRRGSWIAWFHLMARGHVVGGDGIITLKEFDAGPQVS